MKVFACKPILPIHSLTFIFSLCRYFFSVEKTKKVFLQTLLTLLTFFGLPFFSFNCIMYI